MKTRQINKKQTIRCSHNNDYQYSKWHIVTKENNVNLELDEYVNGFAEYDYDLCDVCENTMVNGLIVYAWITIEKALIEAMKMQDPSKHTRNKAYADMEYRQDFIKKIRRSMVSGISGE